MYFVSVKHPMIKTIMFEFHSLESAQEFQNNLKTESFEALKGEDLALSSKYEVHTALKFAQNEFQTSRHPGTYTISYPDLQSNETSKKRGRPKGSKNKKLGR